MLQIEFLSRVSCSKVAGTMSGWRWRGVFLTMIVIFLGVCFPGLNLGFGTHGDSRAVFEESLPAILNMQYIPSRSYGVPLFEFAATGLHVLGGIVLVNIYSLVLSIASIAIFAKLLIRSNGSVTTWSKIWALVAFAFNPLFLINATSPTEWAQAVFFLVCTLSAIINWLRVREIAALATYSVCISALVLTRPDAAVVCVAIGIAVLWELKLEQGASLQFIAGTIVAATVTLAIYLVLNGGLTFLSRALIMASDESVVRRMLVTAASVVNLVGPAGCIALVFGVGRLLVKRRDQLKIRFFEKLFVLSWPIIIVRMISLPDKLEYIFPLIPITLLAIVSRWKSSLLIAVVAGSAVLNSVVVVSFFERKGVPDSLSFVVGLNRSALLQDWDARQAQNRALDPSFAAHVAAATINIEAFTEGRLELKNFNPGFTDGQGALIISKDQLYKLDNPRFADARYRRRSYRRVYVCDGAFIADNKGWRVLQPPANYANVVAGRDGGSIQCEPEH